MTLTNLFRALSYAVYSSVYTGVCNLLRYLPDSVYGCLLPMMFSVNTMGAMERGPCVYLVNYSEPKSDRLALGSTSNVVTSSPEEAIEIAGRLGIPIQTVVCYYSREYFYSGWVYPQPYQLVYEYGDVDVKEEREYHVYFFDKMSSRPSVRLYENSDDQCHSLWATFLFVYLLMSYQPLFIVAAIVSLIF